MVVSVPAAAPRRILQRDPRFRQLSRIVDGVPYTHFSKIGYHIGGKSAPGNYIMNAGIGGTAPRIMLTI